MRPLWFGSLLVALLATSATLLLVGCGSSTMITSPTTPATGYSGAGFTGKAMAGKSPLVGASVQVYAAGTTGNGSTGTALLPTAPTTDSNGAFTVAPGYSCPASGSLIYIVVTGGKPGPSTSANSSITLLTALGACNQITASPQVTSNEVTTVAAVYGLNQFMSAGAKIGGTASNTSGLANSFATAIALADSSNGASPGPTFSANGSSPAPLINTVANLLSACTTQGSNTCATLFSATTPPSGTAPTNTLDAALDLVRNPVTSVATLFNLSATSSLFTPALAVAPPDWTLYIDYSGGGMHNPTGLGLDGSGNVWVANYFNVASLFSPLGKPVFANGITGFGLSASYGLAVDSSGNAWIPNEPNSPQPGNSVSVLNFSGQSAAGSGGYTNGGLNYPIAVTIDADGSAWVVNYGNSHLTHLSSSGQALSGTSGYSSPQLAFPVAAAIDLGHNVWIANQSGATVTKASPDGSQFTSYTCCSAPSGLAIDRQGNVWIANYYGNSVSEISSSGTIVSSGYTGGGLNAPQGIAVDGAGNIWVANYHGSSITELAGASGATVGAPLSPIGGLGPHPAMRQSYALAIDSSGNAWVTNFGSNTLTEFVGVAVPVRTPLIGPPTLP